MSRASDGARKRKKARRGLRRGLVKVMGLAALLLGTSRGFAQEPPPPVPPSPYAVKPPAAVEVKAPSPYGGQPVAPAPVEDKGPSPYGGRPATPPAPRASQTLTEALELQRRGEYEQAAVLLNQALAKEKTLSATEKQELERLLKTNEASLMARQEVRSWLEQAEKALRDKQPVKARDLVKKVTAQEQYLATSDKQRLTQLRLELGGPAPTRAPAPAPAPAPMKESTPVEDPARSAEEAALSGKDAKALLTASRAALKREDLDRAQELVDAAEKHSGAFTFPIWGDTPGKVRRDIQAARKRLGARVIPPIQVVTEKEAVGKQENKPAVKPPPVPTRTTEKPKSPAPIKDNQVRQASTDKETAPPAAKPAPRAPRTAADTENARRMLEAGRKALQGGKFKEATQFAEQAEALKPELNWWEDTPRKLMEDVDRAARARTGGQPKPNPARKPVAPPPPPSVPSVSPDDKPRAATSQKEAEAIVKQGRKLLAAGKLDDAATLAESARAFTAGKYGLFDDTPEKLMADVVKARGKRDRAEADRLTKEARKAFNEGDLDQAEDLAFRAQKLHGSYNIWDLGDRPDKLLAAVQSARVKQGLPPRKEVVADKTPAEDKTPAVDTNREQARQLLADAQAMQKQGQLLEARKKVVEAQALKAAFADGEPSPEQMLLQLAAFARQASDRLVQMASDTAAFGQADPLTNYHKAEGHLTQAKQLCGAFQLDASAIDQKLNWIAQMKARNGVQQAATGTPAAPAAPGRAVAQQGGETPTPEGLTLLENSRMELRRGQLSSSRRMAEEAYKGHFGVKALAAQRLREIDIEEFNQRKLAARRAFDAGLAAYNRRDYFTAREIFGSLTPAHLDEQRAARLRDVMGGPEMASGQAVAADSNVKPAAGVASNDAARATATDQKPETLDQIELTRRLQDVKFQQLREESVAVQRDAGDRFRQGDMDGAMDLLQGFLGRLPESQLDAEKLSLLRRPVEARIDKFKLMKSDADQYQQVADAKKAGEDKLKEGMTARRNKQEKVAELMKKFNVFFKEGKYKEAEMYAQMARDLDPDNPVAVTAETVARMQYRKNAYKDIKDERERFVVETFNDQSRIGPPVSSEHPYHVDPKRAKIAGSREAKTSLEVNRATPKAKEIESKLQQPVSLSFENQSLRTALDQLRITQNINIVPDETALRQERISLERPVSLKLEQVSLKSALNILLNQAELTWVIRDEVLMVTTPGNARGKQEPKIYQVGDLVVPVENYTLPAVLNPINQLSAHNEGQMGLLNNGANSRAPGGLNGGTPVNGSPGSPSPGQGTTPFASAPPGASGPAGAGGSWSVKTASNTQEQLLISLITNTIAPSSWTSQGGTGTIDYFPLGMQLIINQTPDIQEQVNDLLQALRRLQDVEIAIEIRVISIADAFFERIGMDLFMNIKTDGQTRRFEPQITTGQFKPAPFVNDFSPSRLIAGITPAGTFTSDLDIPINPSSFGFTNPRFGNYPGSIGNNGGLSLGLAFLSDLQVFFFMEAAQGDSRTNVMQAPKLIMFNGQTATLTVSSVQFFVTGFQPIQNGGQLFFFPQNQAMQIGGFSITLQPVVSGDRRFVRTNFNVNLTNIAPNVPLFPVITTIQPFFEGVGNVGQPVLFTQFLQQPQMAFISVSTTAQVPDGGTVLLGGLKFLGEGRDEFGPPIISKIPYLNRLVKNTGYGRSSESILLLVTPRIIIGEEEELTQTGVISNPQLAQ